MPNRTRNRCRDCGHPKSGHRLTGECGWVSLDSDIQVEVSCKCLAYVAESREQRLQRRVGQRHNREGRKREERVALVTGAQRVAGPGRMDNRSEEEAIETKTMRADTRRDIEEALSHRGFRDAVVCYVDSKGTLGVWELRQR